MYLILIFTIILILLFFLGILIGKYFYNVSIDKRNVLKKYEEKKIKYKKDKKYKENVDKMRDFISKETKEICITSFDNLKLYGYLKENKDQNIYIIFSHGYGGSIYDLYKYIYPYIEKNYNILLPNLRGHGKSEGNYIGMGANDAKDILYFINYIVNKNKNAKIILAGVSMGAATTMLTLGQDIPKNVVCAIEDCGYTSVFDEFKYQLKKFYKLPSFPFLYIGKLYILYKAKYNISKASCVDVLKKNKVPILFIHGSKDDYVPFYMLDILYNSAICEKEKVVIKNAKHSKCCTTNKEKYFSSIFKFIDKYIK